MGAIEMFLYTGMLSDEQTTTWLYAVCVVNTVYEYEHSWTLTNI